MKYCVSKIEDWDVVAKALVKGLKHGTVITLSGPLGAGKTTFVQALARVLGSRRIPVSPTFSLLRAYALRSKASRLTRLVHVDAYRIEKPEDVLPLGLNETMSESGTIMCVEWPENIADWLARQSCVRVEMMIAVEKDGTRRVTCS